MRYRFLRFPGGREKAITLSYDDGCLADERLVEIVNKHNIKVTLNINNTIPKEGKVSAEKLRELVSDVHEIAIHGFNHIAPGRASLTTGIREVLDCRRDLEKTFDCIIRGMAYPDTGIRQISSGVSKEEIKKYLKALGVAYARTLGEDNNRFNLPEDWYEWMPTVHHKNPELMNYLDEFLNKEMNPYLAVRTPKLFYLWGHSYEFDVDNNWDVLEKFCEKAGGRDDVWYATNIEIYDYVKAYQSLLFSADDSMVYNPTLYEIWFEIDRKLYCIKSGETIKFS